MSVYKEMGTGYLTRTKDLIFAGVSLARRRREEVVSPRQFAQRCMLKEQTKIHLGEKGFGSARLVDSVDENWVGSLE